MSTGRRLAKRSIIGTKVCAPGPDGLWYSGVIHDVKSSPTSTLTSSGAPNSPIETKYLVRFDFKTQDSAGVLESRRAVSVHISPAQSLRRNPLIKEFLATDLIGAGFRSMVGVQLQQGQRVYLTYNGREISGDVVAHDNQKDEVLVKITTIDSVEPIELKKRLEEVRLLESRRSARLADQDRNTDFARLADMGGDRRKTSHSIEVPFSTTPQHNSRKRPPSYAHDSINGDDEEMNENNAAMILVTLSHSPKSPKNGDKWLGSSPASSSASWSSGSSSPPLSDDGHNIGVIRNIDSASARMRTTSVSTSDEGIVVDFKDVPRKKRPKKSKFVCTWKGCNISEHTKVKIERHIRYIHLGHKKLHRTADHFDSDSHDSDSHEEEFYYTEVEDDDDNYKTPSPTSPPTLSHRDMARPPHEDPEYQRQLVGNFKQGRATAQLQQNLQQQNLQQQNIQQQNLQQIHVKNKHQQNSHNSSSNNHQTHIIYVGSNQQQLQQLQNNNTSCIPTSPLAHHNYTWPAAKATTVITTSVTNTSNVNSNNNHNQHVGTTSNYLNNHYNHSNHQHQQQQQPTTTALIKYPRASPRPSQSTAPYPSPTYVHQHHNYSNAAPISPYNTVTAATSSPSSVHHNNSSANSVLQQLSQQNVTVTTTHHNNISHHHQQYHQTQQQQLQQLATVTIAPNYSQSRGSNHQDSTTTHHQQQLQQQQQLHRLQKSPTAAIANQTIAAPNTSSNSTTSSLPGTVSSTSTKTATTRAAANTRQNVSGQRGKKQPPKSSNSPKRRTRGVTKKCRKVYGMIGRHIWCTQCKWKKACTRFVD